MCIYCGTDKYRKIYENHHGPIPKDNEGRTYHIHHIDGNRKNNEITNLVAVSNEDHYAIHLMQEDYAAAARLAATLHLSTEERSEITRLHNLKMTAEGKHPWQGSEYAKTRNASLVEAGTHNFLRGDVQREMNRNRVINRTHPFLKRCDGSSVASDRSASGTNPFQKREDGTSIASDALTKGTHPTQKVWMCEHCGTSGKGASNYSRYHKDGVCLAKIE